MRRLISKEKSRTLSIPAQILPLRADRHSPAARLPFLPWQRSLLRRVQTCLQSSIWKRFTASVNGLVRGPAARPSKSAGSRCVKGHRRRRILFFEFLDRRSSSFSLPDPGNLETRGDWGIPCWRLGLLVWLFTLASRKRGDVTAQEHWPARCTLGSGASPGTSPSAVGERIAIESGVHLFAFRLVGGYKRWRHPRFSRDLRCVFHYARNATGRPPTSF